MSTHYAWVQIVGKVYVEDWEIEERLQDRYPEYKQKVLADEEGMTAARDVCTPDEEREVFQEIAHEKISAHFPSDDPIKYNEALIDMSTYHS